MDKYKGNFGFNVIFIGLVPAEIGVYYCGVLGTNGLVPLYIGRAVGEGVTIRSRLMEHNRDRKWPDVTHFGYVVCSTTEEAIALEASEIKRCQPKYNIQGK